MSDTSGWLSNVRIAVVGLGYVGLPLAVEFGRKFPTIGFDIDAERVDSLKRGHDRTLETEPEDLERASHLHFSTDPASLAPCNVFIVTVPTPIDAHKRPDLRPILGASETVGRALKPGDLVVFESTVYPGCTEQECVPVLQRLSGLKLNEDFTVGYSPERINPGDKQHRLPGILKVTSGSTPQAGERVTALYREIVTAGTFLAESIRVAEAAKVIENTQRDLNIALINELAIIFNRMGIDTEAVLEAAGTKWNFLPFRPGLVGGHCIGVDPYYLTHAAEAAGYHPEIILAGRRLNHGMGAYVAGQMIKAMLKKRIQVDGARVLVLGLTFKENCPDLRNTRVVDVVQELADYGVTVDAFDPWIDADDAERRYSLRPLETPPEGAYDGIILAVAHDQFRRMGAEAVRRFGKADHILYDLKYVFGRNESDLRL